MNYTCEHCQYDKSLVYPSSFKESHGFASSLRHLHETHAIVDVGIMRVGFEHKTWDIWEPT